MDETGTDEAECSTKVASRRRTADAIRSLQLECARVLHESLLVSVLTYGSATICGGRGRDLGLGLYRWTTSEVFLCIRRINKVQNSRIREFCRVTKGVYERIDEGILR